MSRMEFHAVLDCRAFCPSGGTCEGCAYMEARRAERKAALLAMLREAASPPKHRSGPVATPAVVQFYRAGLEPALGDPASGQAAGVLPDLTDHSQARVCHSAIAACLLSTPPLPEERSTGRAGEGEAHG